MSKRCAMYICFSRLEYAVAIVVASFSVGFLFSVCQYFCVVRAVLVLL